MYWFWSVFIWIFLGILCSIIAGRKNRSVGAWLVLGILFGIFALIIIACLPSVETFEEVQTKKKPSISSNKCDELRNIKTLLDDGIITNEEYEQMKKRVINKESSTIDDGLEDLW